MKWGFILGIVSVLFLAAAVLFVARILITPQGIAGEVIAPVDGGKVVVKEGVQEVLLSYKKYDTYKYNYFPEVIEVESRMPVRIIGDESLKGCYASFTIPELEVKHSFLVGKVLEFTPLKQGTFSFACSMGMGGGKFIVK